MMADILRPELPRSSAAIAEPTHYDPDSLGHFGAYGGRLVAEALMAVIEEVTAAYEKVRTDQAYLDELDRLQTHYTGRPSPLYEAARLSEHAGGARIFLKREDLNHTGSHKINNVLGQALLARQMGKTRVIAETGAGQHGVATATACALLGLDCDTERQALNVARMRLLGAEVVSVESGSKTLKDAINEAFRDWVTNADDTYYCFGTAAGPHPFPTMVRDFQRIIGLETRVQIQDQAGRLPDAVTACVGGAYFTRSSTTRVSGWSASRRPGTASKPAVTPRHSPADRPAHFRDRSRFCCRTRMARRSNRIRSQPAWTTPVWVPSMRGCGITDGRNTGRSPTPRRWTRSVYCAARKASFRRSNRRMRWPVRSNSA
jgi:tryptophan synthase beta chain